MASIPFYKLGVLTIKTLAKPISKKVQSYAANSMRFKSICIGIGNTNNKISYYFRSITDKSNHKIKYQKVSEKSAIETGSNLIGEGFIYLVAGGLLVEEYTRSKLSKINDEKLQKEISDNKNAEIEKRLISIERDLSELKIKSSKL